MKESKTPVYIQIHNDIREAIERGEWQVGDRLPSERELSIQFKVSRMTLRQAIQTLADEGILDRKIGSGTYVASQKVQEKMTGSTSFTEIMLAQGKTPSSKTVSYYVTHPSSSEKEKLALGDTQQVLRMERIRYADGVPICFETASVPYDLVAKFSREEMTRSLYQTLHDKGGYEVGKAIQTISAAAASEKIAEYLDIRKGDAILRLRQLTYFTSERAFEYVRSQYVGNRFEFILEK